MGVKLLVRVDQRMRTQGNRAQNVFRKKIGKKKEKATNVRTSIKLYGTIGKEEYGYIEMHIR